MVATHKLTIRLDPEVWEGLQRVCGVNGASVTAFMQALARSAVREHVRHDWRRLDEWADYPEYAQILADALEIDAKRRNRRRSDDT